jgi:hypothetical protein
MVRVDYKSGCVFVQETARGSCKQRRRLIKRRFIKMSRNQGANKSGCRVHALHSLTRSLWILSGWRENDARCLVTPLETRGPRTLKKRFWAPRERNLAPKERPMISPEWEYLRSTLCLLRFGLKERLAFNLRSKCKASIHLRFCALIFSRFEESAHKYREGSWPPLSA